MAYSEKQKERIEKILQQKPVDFDGRNFMGGHCFFIDDKMAMGINIDKETGKDRLMARVGENAEMEALTKKGCRPMDITGRPMKGFVFVDPEGFNNDKDLEYWVDLVVAFNPFAKRSKKRKVPKNI